MARCASTNKNRPSDLTTRGGFVTHYRSLFVSQCFRRVYLGGVAGGHYGRDQRDYVRNQYYQADLEPGNIELDSWGVFSEELYHLIG